MNTHILTIDVNGQRERTLSLPTNPAAEAKAYTWLKEYSDSFAKGKNFTEAYKLAKDEEDEGGDIIYIHIDNVACIGEKTEEPTECPSCGHEEMESGETKHDTGMAWRTVECQGCGTKWIEYFQFKDWEEVLGDNDE